jgi:ornithine cyclodeaminase/alanine dehydrogenase-like protein (mu-crystallin family)
MLFLTESDVMQLLPMSEAIRLMRVIFERLALGEAINQPRRRLILPTGSALHYMAGSDGKYFGAKIYSTKPRFGAHFVFLLYRAEDAQLLAVMQANWLGQIRTGAVSGLATDLMARKDAAEAGMIGTGFQARSQIEAIAVVRRLRRVKVWSRSPEKRAAFAGEYTVTLGIPVEPAETAEEAVRDAAIVTTATNAKDPVIEDRWIGAGTHVNAMGSNQPKRRELPAGLIARADCIAVDSKEQARMESGDLLLNMDETGWASDRLVELADIVAGRVPGRRSDDQITVFKSIGLAVEDVVSAGFVYERAVEAGLGRAVPVYS